MMSTSNAMSVSVSGEKPLRSSVVAKKASLRPPIARGARPGASPPRFSDAPQRRVLAFSARALRSL